MQKYILVTGATGMVGRELVKILLIRDIPLRITLYESGQVNDIRGPNVDTVKVDFRNPDTLRELFRDVGRAYLITPFAEDQDIMVKNLMDAARAFDVERVVRQSVIGAEFRSTFLEKTHFRAEEYVRASGIISTILRPNSFMQNFIRGQGRNIAEEGRIIMPLKDARVSYIDARDIAKAAAVCLTGSGHQNKIYTLTGPEAISVSRVAEILSRALGKSIEYTDIPEREFRDRMIHLGAPEWMVEASLELYSNQRSGLARAVTPDFGEITGEDPRSFERYAEDSAELWQPDATAAQR